MQIDEKMLPSNKKFGLFFSLVFFMLFLYFFIHSYNILYLTFISFFIITLIFTLFFPEKLFFFNKLWFRIGIALNYVISPLILGVIFFLLITPLSIFFKITQRDYLKIKFKHKNTYWVEVTDRNVSKERLEQQY